MMMGRSRNVAILVVITVMLLKTTEAEDYEVGGTTGWTTFPPGGASFYSKWASNFTFKVNDTLVFNFESGSHSVVELSKANYENCGVDNNIKSFNTGPARVILTGPGEFYFSCPFSGHCSSGQKLSVTVEASSPSPSAYGSDSTKRAPSPQTHSTDIAPPPHGSATPLASTFSLFIITIIVNFLSQF
ncbi:mavicyanin-like [Vigna umbellata]|uniref:mavicyanin-like n=1 Tax=Vigna umbellata TaxID=87088 RepID=UPI001F5F8A24|nr:mavicyanin-like [Vigna umbellata]